MNFGQAIEALKDGRTVRRAGWNGKGMWLVLIRPQGRNWAAETKSNTSLGLYEIQPCIGMKTAQEEMQPGWLASQADMLAEDWSIAD